MKELATADSRKIRRYLNTYYSSNDNDKHVLPYVLVKNKANYDVSKRVSENSVVLTSDQINERNSIGNAILNVAGAQLMGGYLVINKMIVVKNVDASSEPLLVVNGVQVYPSSSGQGSPVLNYLNSFDPKSIDFIEILRGPEGARYGMRGGNGVILVNTTNKLRDLTPKDLSMQTFYVTGISKPVLFPITTYEENEEKPSTFIDDRPTLFWNGNYFTDKPENTITFYASGVPSKYRLTVSGVTIHGDIINKTITFKTK